MSALIQLLDRPIAYNPAFAKLRAGPVNASNLCGISKQNSRSHINNLEHVNFGRYSSRAAEKSAAGRGNPGFNLEHNRAHCGFFVCDARLHLSMVGHAGQPKGWPGSELTGISTPVRLTTHERGNSGGELLKLNSEAAIMATIPTLAQPEIIAVDGRAVTTSHAIACYFRKRHDNVIRSITNLECSSKFAALNFEASEYIDPTGRKLPCYQITRDGFAFLAMGFTGKRAAVFKEAYITAFNAMEQALIKQPYQADPRFDAILTDARRLHDNLGIIMGIWADNVQPLNPPIVVSGTIMDSYHRSGLIAGGIERVLRGKQ
ncbi:Rha family transcriptional regulator [Symbiopectobacterium purcellii]|uniref:Rha family phage regulatory protein n=1 Tax=Symbiopectobacterium purcellii TaxID=2871826 RepID=UPI003F842450